jgi:hypothetical protein
VLSSDWQYLGYVSIGVGGAFAIAGSIGLLTSQQGSSGTFRYNSYFLPILIVGIVVALFGVLAFVQANRKKESNAPPPPPLYPPLFPPPPPPLPP